MRAKQQWNDERKNLNHNPNLPVGRNQIRPVKNLSWEQESPQAGSRSGDGDILREPLSTTIENILLQQRSGRKQLLPGTFVMCVRDGEGPALSIFGCMLAINHFFN